MKYEHILTVIKKNNFSVSSSWNWTAFFKEQLL